MRKIYALSIIIAIAGCATSTGVEFGMNDETLDGVAGDLAMRVLKIEVPDGAAYTTVWEGTKRIQIELQTDDFVSITDGLIDMDPVTLSHIIVTVDSLTHVQDSVMTHLIDSTIVFRADAFAPIPIIEGDEKRLAIVIGAAVWFDDDSLQIATGHEPFEGAALRVSYEY